MNFVAVDVVAKGKQANPNSDKHVVGSESEVGGDSIGSLSFRRLHPPHKTWNSPNGGRRRSQNLEIETQKSSQVIGECRRGVRFGR
jgi:hypothetical protein